MKVNGDGSLRRAPLFQGYFHALACGWPWKKAIKKKFRIAVSWKGEGEGHLSCTIWLGEAKQKKEIPGPSLSVPSPYLFPTD